MAWLRPLDCAGAQEEEQGVTHEGSVRVSATCYAAPSSGGAVSFQILGLDAEDMSDDKGSVGG